MWNLASDFGGETTLVNDNDLQWPCSGHWAGTCMADNKNSGAVGTRSATLIPLSSLPCSVIKDLSLGHWSPKLRELSQSWGFPGLSFLPAENWEPPWSLNGSWRLLAISGKDSGKHIMCKSHCSMETQGSSLIPGSSAAADPLLCHKNNGGTASLGLQMRISTPQQSQQLGLLISWETLLPERFRVLPPSRSKSRFLLHLAQYSLDRVAGDG